MPRGQKNSYGCRRRRRRTVRDEDRRGGDWGLPFQSDRTHARASEETDRPAAAARRETRYWLPQQCNAMPRIPQVIRLITEKIMEPNSYRCSISKNGSHLQLFLSKVIAKAPLIEYVMRCYVDRQIDMF